MNRPLRDVALDVDAEAPARPPPPQVFVRALSTPPGLPWEQSRAATLDARHGAPLPIVDLLHQVRRLDRWGPGRPGRFAAFYVRAREFREAFETEVEVDGQAVKVRFGAPAADLGRLRTAGGALAVLVLSGLLLGTGMMLAWQARATVTTQLEAEEQLAASRLRMAEAQRERARSVREVSRLVGQGRPLDEVLADLSWVATSKGPEARVVGVHWERGLLAVEARGEAAPFLAADRALQRSPRPLRPGVWLWAVGRPGSAQAPGGFANEVGP